MGSRTMGSTILTHWQLGVYNILGYTLILIWFFSPLGGQSLLRILHTTPQPISTSATYFDAFNQDIGYDGALHIKSLYRTALVSHDKIKSGPRDLWGNVKIPFLNPDAETVEQPWSEISPSSSNDYSAFVGLPTGNITEGSTTFSVESDYVRLHCEPVTKHIQLPDPDDWEPSANSSKIETTLKHIPLVYSKAGIGKLPNGTWYGDQQGNQHRSELNYTALWSIGLDRFIGQVWLLPIYNETTSSGNMSTYRAASIRFLQNETGIEAGNTKLIFQARRGKAVEPVAEEGKPLEQWFLEFMRTECHVTQIYVESRVSCSKSSHTSQAECEVTAQRPSKKPRSNKKISPLSHPKDFSFISKELPRSTHNAEGAQDVFGFGDPVLNHLFNLSMNLESWQMPFQNLTMKGYEREFSIRLSQMINSYLMISRDKFEPNPQRGEEGRTDPKEWKRTNAETTDSRYVYSISRPWMAVCIISCVILASGGTLSVVFAHLTRGPEVLGYVSSTLRDSRYVTTSLSLSYLEGYEVSKILSKERLRLGAAGQNTVMDPGLGVRREEDALTLQ